MKRCPHCGQIKRAYLFPIDRNRASRRYPICLLCERERGKKKYRKNISKSRRLKRIASQKFRKKYPNFYKDWYKKHARQVIERSKAYRKQDRERWRKYQLKWQRANRKKTREYHARWVSKPRGRAIVRQHARNYSFRKRGAAGSHSAEQWENVKRKFKFCCVICGKPEPEIRLTRDHVIPISKGGSNYISNIQPLCGSCNSKKHDKCQEQVPT